MKLNYTKSNEIASLEVNPHGICYPSGRPHGQAWEYGVFGLNANGKAVFGRYTNVKLAVKHASRLTRGSVRRMTYDSMVWDAPTYRACSEQIFPLKPFDEPTETPAVAAPGLVQAI